MSDLSDYKIELINKLQEKQRELFEQTMNSFIPWDTKAKPFTAQKKFFADKSKNKLVRAGNRAAKSFTTMRNLAWKLTRSHPYRKEWNEPYEKSKPKRFWVLAPTFEFINNVAWKEYLQQFIPEEFYTNSDGEPMVFEGTHNGEKYIRKVFKNGDTLELRTYSQNILSQMGRAIDDATLDEMPPSIKLLSEIIVRVADRGGEISLGFTPLVENEEIKHYCDTNPNLVVHTWSVLDNPIYRDNPEKAERLLSDYEGLPTHLRNARISGDWYYDNKDDVYIFNNVLPQVVDDFVIPLEWRQIRFIDPATSITGALFAAEDPETGEWYVHTALELSWEGVFATSKHIEDEIEKYKPYAGFEYVYSKYDNQGSWFAAHAKGKWYPCVEKNRDAAVRTTRDAINTGKVKFFKCGSALVLRQLQSYRKKKSGKVRKTDDHALDCLMYFCREIPAKRNSPPPPTSDDRVALVRYHTHKILQRTGDVEVDPVLPAMVAKRDFRVYSRQISNRSAR